MKITPDENGNLENKCRYIVMYTLFETIFSDSADKPKHRSLTGNEIKAYQ